MFFEMKSQVRSARFNNSPIHHDVDELRFDVIQQALIMRDDQHAQIGSAQRIDAFCDNAQGIDIQTRIGLIQNGDLGLRVAICRISARFFSPPRNHRSDNDRQRRNPF